MQRLVYAVFPRVLQGLATVLVLALWAGPAPAEPYVYPTKNQPPEQQEKDRVECYTWAKGQTGFDPMAAPETSAPPPQIQSSGTSPLRGAARGAATGAAAGAIAGDTGTGAAAGAAAGAMIGGMRRRDAVRSNAQTQQQYQAQQEANYQARRAEYDRAWAACLEGRGYTVR